MDLAPTILHAMGLAVPEELDGRVLSEAFDAASPLARPVAYSQANMYKDGTRSQASRTRRWPKCRKNCEAGGTRARRQ